ncbi:MAG: CPBP family intramembrane metalloprotease [Bacteroides sp.]|nr:CPBP family intramembrane metalloprotease [Bacteroides sp.]
MGNLLKNLLVLAGAFIVSLMAAGFIAELMPLMFEAGSRDCYLAQSVVQNIVGFCGAGFVAAGLISGNSLTYLGLSERVSLRPFIGVLIVYILGLPAMNQLIYYNSIIPFPDSLSGIESWMKQMEELNGRITDVILSTHTIGGLISGILIIGVLTGFSEEVLFRGTLQKIMTSDNSISVWGIWIAAFIFSAVHLQFYGFFPRLLLGAFFGYIFFTTGSLWPAVFAHALNNSMVVAGEWLSRNYPSLGFDDKLFVTEHGFPIVAFVSLIATILFFYKFYNYFFDGCKRQFN